MIDRCDKLHPFSSTHDGRSREVRCHPVVNMNVTDTEQAIWNRIDTESGYWEWCSLTLMLDRRVQKFPKSHNVSVHSKSHDTLTITVAGTMPHGLRVTCTSLSPSSRDWDRRQMIGSAQQVHPNRLSLSLIRSLHWSVEAHLIDCATRSESDPINSNFQAHSRSSKNFMIRITSFTLQWNRWCCSSCSDRWTYRFPSKSFIRLKPTCTIAFRYKESYTLNKNALPHCAGDCQVGHHVLL